MKNSDPWSYNGCGHHEIRGIGLHGFLSVLYTFISRFGWNWVIDLNIMLANIWASLNLTQERPYVYACTVKQYDISEVKYPLVTNVTEWNTGGLITAETEVVHDMHTLYNSRNHIFSEYMRFFSQGVVRTGHEFDHSPPSNVEAKNEWSYTSPLLYALMVCICTNLTLPYTFR